MKEEISRNVYNSSYIFGIFSWISSEPTSFEKKTNVNLNPCKDSSFLFPSLAIFVMEMITITSHKKFNN